MFKHAAIRFGPTIRSGIKPHQVAFPTGLRFLATTGPNITTSSKKNINKPKDNIPTTDPSAFPSTAPFENEIVGNRLSYDEYATSESSGFSGEEVGDFTKSFKGISNEPFPREITDILMEPLKPTDIECKPDGMLYLPEIKYRRILNRAFGPGGWGLIPRGPHTVNNKNISREWALFAMGRFVSQARGEQDYFGPDALPTAAEGCKSNALLRCCKDLGIASELWDPAFIREFRSKHCTFVPCTNITSQVKKLIWRRKDRSIEYPWREDRK